MNQLQRIAAGAFASGRITTSRTTILNYREAVQEIVAEPDEALDVARLALLAFEGDDSQLAHFGLFACAKCERAAVEVAGAACERCVIALLDDDTALWAIKWRDRGDRVVAVTKRVLADEYRVDYFLTREAAEAAVRDEASKGAADAA